MNQQTPSYDNIGSLTEQQQMKVLDFMAVTDTQDFDKAVLFMKNCGFNINLAIQAFMDGKDPTKLNQIGDIPFHTTANNGIQNIPLEESKGEPNHLRELRESFKKHYAKKKKEEEDNSGFIGTTKRIAKSIGSGITSIWNIFPIAIRGEKPGGEKFINYFSKKYPNYAMRLDFKLGTLTENVALAHREKKLLLLYAHLDGKLFENIPKIVFESEQLISFIKKNFVVFGLLANSDTCQETSKYLKTKDLPCLAVFRLNLVDEVTLVQHVALTSDGDPSQIHDMLIGVIETWKTLGVEEEKIKRDVRRSLNNNRGQSETIRNQISSDFVAPRIPRARTQVSQAQLEEARLLREQQEREFKEVEELIRVQQESEREAKRKAEEERENQRKQEELKRTQELEQKRLKELQKQECKERLPAEPSENEPNTILLLFRLPNGERVTRRFLQENKVSVLYDFIDSMDLKFEETEVYDLMQPMPFLSLEERDKTIADYFGDSQQETLVVREKI